jgi:hypothetical protein
MVTGRKDRWSDITGVDGCTLPLRYSFFIADTLDRMDAVGGEESREGRGVIEQRQRLEVKRP